jgi:hypothetical protein
LLGYIVMGTIVYCVMITLGEMVCLLHVPDVLVDHISNLHFFRLLSCLYLAVTSNWQSASSTLHSLLPWVGITGIAGWYHVRPIFHHSFLANTDLLFFSTLYLCLMHFISALADFRYHPSQDCSFCIIDKLLEWHCQ